MIIVKVCVGSSCYLKGAPEIVALMEKKIEEYALQDEIALIGSFCAGKCNRVGVTITVGDEVYSAITPSNFEEFFNDKVLPAVNAAKGDVV